MGTYAITGAGRGIGAAIAARLASQGHRIIAVDISGTDISADVSTAAGRAMAVAAIRQAAPEGLDGLVPCAGVGPMKSPHSQIAKINYFGAIATVEGLKDTLAKRRGSALLIGSNSAWIMPYDQAFIQALLDMDEPKASTLADALGGQDVYGAGKQALVRWMRRHVRDYVQHGVRLNALAPGYTSTVLTHEIRNDPAYRESMDDFIDSIPIGRPADVEDQAGAAAFLLGPDAAYICGSVLYVDGGHDASLRPDQG